MIIRFDVTNDFWKLYPQFVVGFSELYNSLAKEDSSRIMWAIALYVHPDSIYSGMGAKERLEIIKKDYLKDFIFDDDTYKGDINLFKRLCMSKKERYLHEWEKKLDERDEFLSSVPYEENSAEFLDKLMGNTKKLQEQYDRALEDFQKEKTDTSGKGGAEESLRERLKA